MSGVRRLVAGLVTLALVLMCIPAAQARTGKERWREKGTVVKVVDGDTFDIETDHGPMRVWINGIQAPERGWCGGTEARKALSDLLPKGTLVRLASIKERSGNAPGGVWRIKRTVHVRISGRWMDIAPNLLQLGTVFPFPFIGEKAHNRKYLSVAWAASQRKVGLYDPRYCGRTKDPAQRLRLEVMPDGPGGGPGSEFVMVFNGSDRDINISGWMVQDTSPLNAYFFPKRAKVRANDYVVVFSSEGTRGVGPDGSADDRFYYAGTGSRWNNDTAEIAFLFDDTGKDKTGNLRAWQILTPKG